jgi:chlorophyllide a reductase subunit Y
MARAATVGYVPFNSESLVTGKLFEDMRDAVYALADPDRYDTIIITNLCVPTASGVPLKPAARRDQRRSHRRYRCPGFGVPTHAEAKDVLAGAMLAYARKEAPRVPSQAGGTKHRIADRVAARRNVPGRSRGHRPADLSPSASAPAPSCRRANGANSIPRSTVPSSPPSIPFYTSSVREFARRPSGGRLGPGRQRRHGRLARCGG